MPTWWENWREPAWTVSLLPTNATAWETAIDLVDADLVSRNPVGLIAAARSDAEVPTEWLAYLAEERSVDEFSSEWPEARQRRVTAASRGAHQVKGTRPAIDRALRPIGYAPIVVEWFEVEPRRQPHTFRVLIEIDTDREWRGGRGEIIRVANGAKNAHTKLEAIEVLRRSHPGIAFVGGYARRTRIIRVGQLPKVTTIRRDAWSYIGVVSKRRRTLRVGPRQ